MDIKWKYKIELRNNNVFEKIENELKEKVPEELKVFIRDANAGIPDKDRIIIQGEERVLGAILSFNEIDEDVDMFNDAFQYLEKTDILPFAIDPSGNYFCYALKDGKIMFWNHELDDLIKTEYTLNSFLEALY
ncbi:MAG: SMI1/KNR4 family protein [Lachnospiraceae bacterium]|nr:SMI1/KNR4 family protein [Lachnospiraceae bacterium]